MELHDVLPDTWRGPMDIVVVVAGFDGAAVPYQVAFSVCPVVASHITVMLSLSDIGDVLTSMPVATVVLKLSIDHSNVSTPPVPPPTLSILT